MRLQNFSETSVFSIKSTFERIVSACELWISQVLLGDWLSKAFTATCNIVFLQIIIDLYN